jgi:phenylalanyl-tRNA synthetase beta chain
MPTIEISLEDLNSLVGKEFSIETLEKALEYVKGEIEEVNGDRIKIEIADTNRPDLWSVEGIARELKARYTKDVGFKKYKIKKSGIKVIVDRNLKDIRPKTVCAVVKGLKITDETLFQMIQLQEKICENFGRGRKEVALGIYDYHKISPPIYFKAYEPHAIKFVPLDFDREMDLEEILDAHPKGKMYGHLLKDKEKYPIFIDAKGNVLSMPPIINSNYSGKVTKETKDVFIECSGFDLRFLMPSLNVMVTALAERGGKIESVKVILPDGKIETPDLKPKKIILKKDNVKKLSGLELNDKEIKRLLLKARYSPKIKGKKIIIEYSSYRQDIMHEVDVIEDIIINYGYNNIKPLFAKIDTKGELTSINTFFTKIAEIMVGLGSQEIMSYILTNKENLITKMNIEPMKVIELENPVSKNWCVFRTWLLPSLMEFLSNNTHNEYPQNIFEIGEVVIFDEKAETKTKNSTRLAWAYAGSDANFTKAKQSFDFLMRNLGVEYTIEETEHKSFIEGRVGRVLVNNRKVAYIGEIHPIVLENFGINQPVCAFEINISDLLEAIKKI